MNVFPDWETYCLFQLILKAWFEEERGKNLWTCFPSCLLAEEGILRNVWIYVVHAWGRGATTASPMGLLSPPAGRPEGERPPWPIMMLLRLRGPCSAWGCESAEAYQEWKQYPLHCAINYLGLEALSNRCWCRFFLITEQGTEAGSQDGHLAAKPVLLFHHAFSPGFLAAQERVLFHWGPF